MDEEQSIGIIIFDFDETLSKIHTCKTEINNFDIIADPDFIVDLVCECQEMNIPLAIASFGKENIIYNVMNNLFSKYNMESPFKIGENIFGNECIAMKPCKIEKSVKDKRLMELYSKTNKKKQFPCSVMNQNINEFDSAVGKLAQIEYITKYYNINKDDLIVFYDDSEQNIKILELNQVKQKISNIKPILVPKNQHLTRKIFCQDDQISNKFNTLCNDPNNSKNRINRCNKNK